MLWGRLALLSAVVSQAAYGELALPYTRRVHDYSAYGTTVQGDLETVGMAGAMVGLADSRVGSVDNPAGVAMTLDSTGLSVTGNSVQDGYVQSYASMITTSYTVLSFCPHPWGLSFASLSPSTEEDRYQIGGGNQQQTFIRTREYHLSFAHLFFEDRLSLGVSLILGENSQRFTPSGGYTHAREAWGYGVGFGAQYALPGRVLLGLSYTPAIRYRMDPEGLENPLIQDFFRDARAPYRLSGGVGWLPNRFFKASAGLYVFGPTENTSLMADDARMVGSSTTMQPRVGVAYTVMDYRELEVEIAAGTYLEVLRIQDDFPRLHGTFSLEIKPWIFTIGWGLDEARFYQNFIYSAGIDFGKVMRKLRLIPQEPPRAYGGTLPNPWRMSDEGMPHALNPGWQKRDDNALDIGLRMPRLIGERILSVPEDMKTFGGEVVDTLQSLPGDIRDEGVLLWRRSGGPGLGVGSKAEAP